MLLLVKDPHTVWVTWDFSNETERRAREGLPHARPVLRITDQGRVVREVEIALGRAPGTSTTCRRPGATGPKWPSSTNWVEPGVWVPRPTRQEVPPSGPSPYIDDCFVRIPPAVPMAKVPEPIKNTVEGAPFPAASSEMLWQRAEAGLRGELRLCRRPCTPRRPRDGISDTSWNDCAQAGIAEVLPGRVRGADGPRICGTNQPGQMARTRFGGRWTSSWPS